MKKRNLIFVAMLFVALSFGFSACENPDDNEELLNRIEQLENQLKDQQSGKDDDKTDSADKDGDKDTSSDNEQNGDGTPDPDEGEGGSSDDSNSNLVPAAFSVSSTQQVYFSPGNLQYHPADDEWRFAENQTDYIGDANSNISSTYNGWIDLFGWGTGANPTNSSTDYNDYQTFVDWGTNQIGADVPNTWRTLTYDEWYYLRYERPNYDELIGVAQVNGVNGLILLPDAWICPEGITFKSGFHSNYGVDYYAAYQTFTADQWSKMEQAGAVFLPAAGLRYGSDVRYVQGSGGFWSATGSGSYGAYGLGFYSDVADVGSRYRNYGLSVRFVKDL